MSEIFICLNDLRKELGKICDDILDNGKKDGTYFIQQYQRAINSFSTSDRKGKYFRNEQAVIRQIESKMRSTVPFRFKAHLKKAIENTLSNTNRNRSRSPRQRRRTSPKRIYDNSDIYFKQFISVLAILYQSNDTTDKFLFKPTFIFGILATAFEEAMSQNQKREIKKYLTQHNIAVDTSGGEYVLVRAWKPFLFALTVDNNEKINEAIQLKVKRKTNKKKNKKKKTEQKDDESEFVDVLNWSGIPEKNESDCEIINSDTNNNENKYKSNTNWKGLNQKQWILLSQISPQLFKKRLYLVNGRVMQLIASDFGGDLNAIFKDGNCLINCVLFETHGALRLDDLIDASGWAILEREEMIEYIQLNQLQFAAYDIDQITSNEFSEDKHILETPHVLAIHYKEKLNIVILEFDEKLDNFHFQIFYDKEYDDTLFMEMSERGPNHFNYIQMPRGVFKFSSEEHVQYLSAQLRPNSEFLLELQNFDMENNIQSIINGHIHPNISKIFSNKSSQLISIYGMDTLLNVIENHSLKLRNIQNQPLQSIANQIADLIPSATNQQ